MHYNPFGPKPIAGFEFSNESLHDYSSQDKWLLAATIGVFGGGIAYLFYKRKFRHAVQQRSSVKQPNRTVDREFSRIQDLPPEIRTQIWQTLPYEDLLNLRLTSQFTKFDIDTFVGLCGRITSADPQKYDFYQSIALQSCKITELQHPINDDFFLNPNILQSLEIREHSPIPLDNIRAILSVSINLKTLKLRLTLNGNTQEISQMVLEYLPEMKSLVHLHVKTTSRYSPEMKNFTSNAIYYSLPNHLKTVRLEMPDLSAEQLSKWKCVLDRQTSVESIACNMGNVHWRLYERVLRHNSSSIEKVVLEGLRGWNLNRDTEDPFDWNVFSDFVTLKSIDLSCNRGGDHDLMDSVNFETLPCLMIMEFYISRILLPPEAVDRVYTEMINLQRGALDHIGNPGIERANEMAWIIQADGGANERWWHDDRVLDLMAHGICAIILAIFLSYIVRNRSNGENYALFGHELQYYKQDHQVGNSTASNS